MKPYVRSACGLVGLAVVVVGPALLAAVVTTTYPQETGIATSSYVPLDYSNSTSIAASASNSIIVALNAQASMLKQMVREHQSRATELTQKNQSEKAKWETELVSELQEKSERVQKNIDQMSQPDAHNLKTGGDTDDELVFMSMVQGRLAQIRDELSAASADTTRLSMEVATNKVPEAIGPISSVLAENQRVVRELQKEQFDLELRKLEFRQTRRATQR